MNKTLLTFLLLLSGFAGFANHIKGGFFTYQYLGPGTQDPNSLKYKVVLTVYMVCDPNPQQLDASINFTLFDAGSNSFIKNIPVPINSDTLHLGKDHDDECITGNQIGCYYTIVTYTLNSIELPPNANGYTFSYQRCCRITGVQNIAGESSGIGNTYSITIPGSTTASLTGPHNSSATFLINDTVVLCGNSYFKYPFSAVDPDGDQLTYTFCSAWTGGSMNNATPTTASAPPYAEVPYAPGFSGSQPLGVAVSIDPNTGVISGIAPPGTGSGEYVVTVCVNEIRNGSVIATTRKELHVRIGNCQPIQATLDPSYITCDGYTLSFFNVTPSIEIKNYYWDFGVANSTTDISTAASPTFTYQDTGVYTVKLVVNRGEACTDSTTAIARVFPGFTPNFYFTGVCYNKPTHFFDSTQTVYGVVDTWHWNFGDDATAADTANIKNPSYTYTQLGTKNVELIVTNSKGCVDTLNKAIEIIDKPVLSVAFKDTLICNGDVVPLKAIGNGAFTWTPSATLTNANTATPTAQPTTTTTYNVKLDDNGCINNDTVRVRVVNFVTLRARGDTVICATDPVQLFAVSDALHFEWTPANTLNNANLINPIARPTATTTYQVKASIGHCDATDDVLVTLVPYPLANAGPDTVICYGTSAQLNATIKGNSFTWSPSASLNNPTILNPVATPTGTTNYILTVRDNIGCPKPGRDTIVVKVLPKMIVSAGNDTAVIIGQPLQLTATGGTQYLWTPPTALNNPKIANPIAIYDGAFDALTYKVYIRDQIGCLDSASVTVKVFKTDPRIFVPTAFTPNNDGKNDTFKFIAVGISNIEYFRVYNRWGQLVFSTTINGQGWDGKINGVDQSSGTYVWLVRGTDFTGKIVFAKGTVTLIR